MISRIALVGYRASGKTTVGQLLGQALGWPYLDADVVLETTLGCSISELFKTQGEAYFRDFEEHTLQTLLQQSPLVLSTGGGVVLRPINRERLKQSAFVVWLTAPAEVLWERLQLDPLTGSRRPNLAQGGLAEVQELLAKREPFYAETATLQLDTLGKSPEQLAATILSEWRARQAPANPTS